MDLKTIQNYLVDEFDVYYNNCEYDLEDVTRQFIKSYESQEYAVHKTPIYKASRLEIRDYAVKFLEWYRIKKARVYDIDDIDEFKKLYVGNPVVNYNDGSRIYYDLESEEYVKATASLVRELEPKQFTENELPTSSSVRPFVLDHQY